MLKRIAAARDQQSRDQRSEEIVTQDLRQSATMPFKQFKSRSSNAESGMHHVEELAVILSDANDVISKSHNPISNQYKTDPRGNAALPSFVENILKSLDTQKQRYLDLQQRNSDLQQQISKMSLEAKYGKKQMAREIEEIKETYLGELARAEHDYNVAMAKMKKQWNEDIGLRVDGQKEMAGSYEVKLQRLRQAHALQISSLHEALLAPVTSFTPLTESECHQSINKARRQVHILAFDIVDYDRTKLGVAFDQVDFIKQVDERDEKLILESYIWLIIVRMVFSTPFAVFGEYGDIFNVAWTNLFGSISSKTTNLWPEPSPDSEHWRHATMQILQNHLIEVASDENSRLDSQFVPLVMAHQAQLVSSYELHKRNVVNKICDAFTKISANPKTVEIDRLIEEICAMAIKFGHQRSRIQIFTPDLNDIVSTLKRDQFEDLNSSNRRSIAKGKVLLVVHPGLLRQGDSQGITFREIKRIRAAGVYLKELQE